jgi:glyoxylase-like metal-dependent hydrolase (beta-lactamase superfamily II)
VETGFSHTTPKALRALEELEISPQEVAYIAVTHVHMDHAGGAGFLAEECPHAQVICHHVGAPHLIRPEKLVRSVQRAVGPLFPYYGEMKPIPEERLIIVRGGERFELGDGYALEVLDAPGHAPHHACFYEPRTRGLFTGDAVGIYRRGIGFIMTTPPPSFHFEESLITLNKLRQYELKWLYFTHFGAHPEPYKLMDAYEERLREWVGEVEAKWQELRDEEAVQSYFVEKESQSEWARLYEPHVLRAEVIMNVTGVLLYLKRREQPSGP